jgi:hypothetical protein
MNKCVSQLPANLPAFETMTLMEFMKKKIFAIAAPKNSGIAQTFQAQDRSKDSGTTTHEKYFCKSFAVNLWFVGTNHCRSQFSRQRIPSGRSTHASMHYRHLWAEFHLFGSHLLRILSASFK